MQYSPLCDVDRTAYFAYLLSGIVRDGCSIERLVCKYGGDCGNKGCGGCGSNGSLAADVFSRVCMAVASGVDRVDNAITYSRVGDSVSSVVGDDREQGTEHVAGMGSHHDGGCNSCVDADIPVGQCGNAKSTECGASGDRADQTGSKVPLVSERTLRNREKRRRAKERKERKQAAQRQVKPEVPAGEAIPEWRRKDVVKPDAHPMGFWKNCSDEVRQQLIDSKARMHIAENERKTREAMNRVAYLDSPQAIVDEVTRMINRAENLAQKQGDAKILGWAKTVTNSSAESLARSAPSTVPTFESVSTRVDEANALENFKRDCAAKENLAKVHQECDERGRKIEELEAKVRELEKGKKPEVAKGPKVSSLLRENGVPYDIYTARAWVARYAHLKGLRDSSKSYVQMAVASNISVDEVRKYFHLKKEFSL